MRFVDVPVAELRGLVLIEAEVDAHGDFRTLQRVGEVEIGGRVVDRIAAQDDEQVDFAGAHVGDEVAEGFGLIDWIRVDRVGVENGLADVAELRVHRMGQSVDGGWLVIAGDHKARTRGFD